MCLSSCISGESGSKLAQCLHQVVSIFAGVRGYLDNIEVSDVTHFAETLLARVRAEHGELLATIRDEGELSDDSDAKLTSIMDDFAKTFA